MNEFPPTCLMIKQHQETRLLYLCKSSNKNAVDKYKGSGKYWKSHIKLHGEDKVETIWACWFFEKTGLVETALLLSSMYDVVDSNGWAN
nr:hypothetical protein [Coprothermobacter proteolyticus]